MFRAVENRISEGDRARAYHILGFEPGPEGRSIPPSLYLPVIMDTAGVQGLHAQAAEDHRHRSGRGVLSGLTEYRVGVELVGRAVRFGLTEMKRGQPNHAGREVDWTRTIVGTIHTHPWDVSQSIGDVRNLIRTNDILGGVVTFAGRVFLLVKDPDRSTERRSAFAQEAELQRASLQETPSLLRRLGPVGALKAAFDVPVQAARDPYIRALCARLGLIYYSGDIGSLTVHRG
jgi:hypothetical protein